MRPVRFIGGPLDGQDGLVDESYNALRVLAGIEDACPQPEHNYVIYELRHRVDGGFDMVAT